jgi:hypothetical protein
MQLTANVNAVRLSIPIISPAIIAPPQAHVPRSVGAGQLFFYLPIKYYLFYLKKYAFWAQEKSPAESIWEKRCQFNVILTRSNSTPPSALLDSWAWQQALVACQGGCAQAKSASVEVSWRMQDVLGLR